MTSTSIFDAFSMCGQNGKRTQNAGRVRRTSTVCSWLAALLRDWETQVRLPSLAQLHFSLPISHAP